jgi:hypothetical protein
MMDYTKYQMTPSLYKINFPSAQDFFLPGLLERISSRYRQDKSINLSLPPSACIAPEFLKLKNFNCSEVLIFAHKLYHEPTRNYIHTDHSREVPKTASKVGFNWVINHYGTMSFWSYDTVKEQSPIKIGYLSATISKYEPISFPEQTYEMNADSVYMVNAGIPHQVTSFENRACISVRWYDLDSYSWDEVVEMFSDEIEPVPQIEYIP